MPKALLLALTILLLSAFPGKGQLIVCGSDHADIITILKANGIYYKTCTDHFAAVNTAPKGGGILFLADDYPTHPLQLPDSLFQLAAKKNLRLYIEYPAHLPRHSTPDSLINIRQQRGIITTHAIAGLDSLNLLDIHNSTIVPLTAPHPLIVLGKVAGFEKADFGISDVTCYPLLFRRDQLLVASTQLSNCITGRFGPSASWQRVWTYILHWLQGGAVKPLTHWPLQLSPMYGAGEKLPADAFHTSILKGSDWYYKAKFLVDRSWENLFLKLTAKNGDGVSYPAVGDNTPAGDGSLGMLEGHVSMINQDGTQPERWWIRADCQAEAAQALALSGNYLNRSHFKTTAANLLDYVFEKSNLRAGPRNDPNSSSFGLIGWATTNADTYYGDDNARVILGAIGASAAIDTGKWDPYIVQAIMGNFRTAGKKGFRGNSLRDSLMQKAGWARLFERALINAHPHYESWLWACYLWLYRNTGYAPLLDRAETAIRITMEAYPNWKWTNGIQQERARMILPLAWLIRVQDTPEHRKWLKRISDDLLENLQPCGAIREALGAAGSGKYGAILSNAAYGMREAPLIAKNGDPVADLLYTMNFAFFGLNEAARATGDARYSQSVKNMADFLLRIQVHSRKDPGLDGAWFRAFDYRRWDYWASNADVGWGAWCTETGWIQGWIVSTLVLMEKQSSFWQQSRQLNKAQAMSIIHAMLEEK